MKAFLRSHWFWFFSALSVYSVYDYIDHITREGEGFREHYLQWFGFTLFSTLSIIGGIYGTHLLLNKLLKRSSLILEALAVSMGVIAHVYFTGPLFDLVFWRESQLTFFFSWRLIGLLVGVYLVVRLTVYFILKLIDE